ncbi:hypothetical protein AVEN_254533-1 [Araneus ventricosus]|uniref:Uncharacterized protein n=1 Tax=Araneus ventricosus TaxID=182803 RepID=A0A4Y2QN83_ARAVE|nr:hypothetical protein AVEN_254533-1 [Araneus ventricosus]
MFRYWNSDSGVILIIIKNMRLRLGYNVLFLKQHEGYLGTHPVILNRGQMTRTTPELALPNFLATPTGGRLATTYDLACNRPHTRRIFSGIGFRTCGPPVPMTPLAFLEQYGYCHTGG